MPVRRRGVSDREVEQAIASLKKGAHILKFDRQGNSEFCPFRLSADEKILIWHTGNEEKKLKLSSIRKIIPGQQEIFHDLPFLLTKHQSFSLVFENGERSLDLICKDMKQAETWILGLTSLTSTSHRTPVVSHLSDDSSSPPCTSSYIRDTQMNQNQYLENSARFSQMQGSHGSPQPLLLERERHLFNGPDTSARRTSSTAHSVPETRLPHLPKIIYHSIKERIRERNTSEGHDNKIKTVELKPSSHDSLKDLYMWGEGIEGGYLGGGLKRFGNNDGLAFDALIPRLLESSSGKLNIQNISCGTRHAGVVTEQGKVFCWGEDNSGRLGHKISMDVPSPKIVESLEGIHISTVACGANHSCALTNSGELYSWGDSFQGTDRNQWIPHKFSGLLEGIQITKVACGNWHTAVLSSSGSLFTYGLGTFGVLGHGNVEDVSEPKEVESLRGLRVKSVACGPWHTAAIVEIMVDRFQCDSTGGKLFTWGDNERGRLGHGDEERKLLPTCIASLVDYDFMEVTCSCMMTIGLTVTGKVFTMGSSENGQLGNPQAEDKSITVVEGCLKDKHVKKISSGSFHVVALTMEGEVYSWGKGANGRLGLGDTEDRNSPALVRFLTNKQIETVACGSNFTAAVCVHKSHPSKNHQSTCSQCKMFFNITRRKHNCCNCGLAFCNSCSSKRAITKTKSSRVCDHCFTQLERATCNVSKTEIHTPRLRTLAVTALSSQKTGSEETIHAQTYVSSPYVCGQEEVKSLQRQTSVKHRKEGKNEEALPMLSGIQRWGEVSCPPYFTLCKQELTKVFSTPSNLHSISLQEIPTTAISLTPRTFTRSEEIQWLHAEVRNLTKECHVKSEKLRIYKQRIDETWSVAMAEAKKCKTAKDIIKALTTKISAMSGIIYAGEELNHLVSALYGKFDLQVQTVQTKHQQAFSPSNMSNSNTRADLSRLPADEWVERVKPGVYITFLQLPSGKKTLKLLRFSRKHFSEKEAKKWWNENQRKVYLKYNVEEKSETNKTTS